MERELDIVLRNIPANVVKVKQLPVLLRLQTSRIKEAV
jgi:hypothetical protein